MNYRHAFHAGNFADVVKHCILWRIVAHLRRKETAFRVIDTHAGAGRYDLTGAEATRSPEWCNGIARIFAGGLQAPAGQLIDAYLDTVRSFNPDGILRVYPGSPLLIQSWLRDTDRLVACELEKGEAAALRRNLRGDTKTKAVPIDGWMALGAYVPPKERRGLVLIDPPYERPDEFATLADTLCEAWRKWQTGIYLAWYPIKNDADGPALIRRLRSGRIGRILRAELILPEAPEPGRLLGSGQIVVNPPWTLENELNLLLSALVLHLAEGRKYIVRIEYIER